MLTRNVDMALKRIMSSSPNNPTSVFVVRNKNKKPVLDVLFGNTVAAHQRKFGTKRCEKCHQHIAEPREEWIGDFHRGNNRKNVRHFLLQAIDITKEKTDE